MAIIYRMEDETSTIKDDIFKPPFLYNNNSYLYTLAMYETITLLAGCSPALSIDITCIEGTSAADSSAAVVYSLRSDCTNGMVLSD